MTITVQSLIQWLMTFCNLLEVNIDYLGQLDGIGGDGDHGVNMARGVRVIRLLLTNETFDSPTHLLTTVGDGILDGIAGVRGIGGAAGAFYESFISGISEVSRGHQALDYCQFAIAIQSGVTKLMAFGGAELNDVSMVDAAWQGSKAFSDSLQAGDSFSTATHLASQAAHQACEDIYPLQARVGRFALIDSRNMYDPGAASMALLFDALQAITRE